MELRKKTDSIIIHCAATKPSMDIGYKEIREWHVDQNGWDDVGYHFIIRRNGQLEKARPEGYSGAHAPSHNGRSIGICLVGGMAEDGSAENNFTLEQFLTLKDLVNMVMDKYSDITEVLGHCDVQDNKPNCPGFNVKEWLNKEAINVA
jgi:N-acetyl-anhydromuramyl-L-alanine amidase AmpD|tara:strand:+ start:204 stop:647 length:444 start_codon:yes stop_codon:yes gene_type:complete